jgi:predicted enzyme related to lactoylglutathione lyase
MAHPVVWFEVLGNDGAKLQAFYAELFGWKINADNKLGYGMVDADGGRGIPGGVGKVFGQMRPWVTFYVESADLAGSLARAEKLGGKVMLPPTKMEEGPQMAFFADPEGHVIGLVVPMT